MKQPDDGCRTLDHAHTKSGSGKAARLAALMIGLLAVPPLTAAGSGSIGGATTRPASEIKPRPDDKPDGAVVGRPGWEARYVHEGNGALPGSVVREFTLAWGQVEERKSKPTQWIRLSATKAADERFTVWLLADGYPPPTLEEARQAVFRYVLQEGTGESVEFKERDTGTVVLPSLGGWQHLLPRAGSLDNSIPTEGPFPRTARYLGHAYRLIGQQESESPAAPPTDLRVVSLLPDVLVGVAGNTRQRDETRRYDDSDYELVRLTQSDYREMVDAGMNCLRVDAEQLSWVRDWEVFYWGVGGADLPYPECLYRSQYLGPVLFLDEPAVCTRDHVIRPRLREDPHHRKTITPQSAFDAFEQYFHETSLEHAPWALMRALEARPDVDLGLMRFRQENLHTWETMVSTAAYQLSQDPRVPSSVVFEPPGRVGTLRTLPEIDMNYGCQIPVADPNNLLSILTGFLRGSARATDKSWGVSIYGSVDRADAFWYLTHAYDLGATRFLFWDSHRLACVPYHECLALARALQNRVENRPYRDLDRLARAAEVAILLPPGYNLGHVHLGRGNLWGVGELNLEQANRSGVSYRTVMGNFFTEIERCLRLGVAFDLLWDLPEVQPTGYREVVRIREDGKVDIQAENEHRLLDGPRVPERPEGAPPGLAVELSSQTGTAPLRIAARATVRETTAPVYYTLGTDLEGVYRNAVVAWELYGPGEEDNRDLRAPGLKPHVTTSGAVHEVEMRFTLVRPGQYRLRTSTVDMAGRTTTVWKSIRVTE
ncbi:MAG: hypothetical protein KDM81_02435 [Verrucomicrobiae bacterium]|nr:hypothetical protein [Verrucomicrobiae bacterium]